MLNQSNVKQAMGVDVVISPRMATALLEWSLLYQNMAPWINDEIHSLNLPAAIASEIARMTTIEMEVEVSGSPRADYLDEQLEPLVNKLRQYVEYGAAKGGLVMKPYVSGLNIGIDCIQADMFYPVSFDANQNMTACIFADQKTIGNKYYTRLEFHQMTKEGCLIKNLAFRSETKDVLGESISLGIVSDWEDIQPEALITGINRPLYAYFRYPAANNIDPTSPLGVSCYARAVDLIRDADKQWSNFLWEFESGQRALYTDVQAWDKDLKTGKVILPNRRLYRTLNGTGTVGSEELFKEWTPTIREQNILNGLDSILKQIEFSCGLAYGTLSNPQSVEKTATEIASSRQRTYATITDAQKSLEDALENLVYAMDVWATLANLAPAGKYTANYSFDDSIVTDHTLQFSQDSQTVGMNSMPKYVFLMRNYGIDELTARKWIEEVQADSMANMDLFSMGGNSDPGQKAQTAQQAGPQAV